MRNVIRVNFGDAVDGEPFGVVRVADRELLTSAQCAELVGVKVGTWRSLVNQGYAPAADGPSVGPVRQWTRGAVEAFIASRPGRTGRPRKVV